MKLIILGDELKSSYGLEFKVEWLLWISAAVISLLFILILSIWIAVNRGHHLDLVQSKLGHLEEDLLYGQYELDEFYTYADSVFVEHAKQAGSLQARVARLEALGKRLAHMADFDSEFDFNASPAFGGADSDVADKSSNTQADILQISRELSKHLDKRESELKALESLLTDKKLHKDQYLAGKPVEFGWLSSGFGKRIDPFSGHLAMHEGVDYTAPEGSDINAVASGVVIWSGNRNDGYGQSVDIDNGNGFVTRYAHNKKNLVAIGDVVTKGQKIAQLGSTGRSTGSHVHFEVLKQGRAVDPIQYIYRDSL